MKFETIETWLDKVTESQETRKTYKQHTTEFFEMFSLNPDKLIEQ